MRPTVDTVPLTIGQRIAAEQERGLLAEPGALAAAIDAEIARLRAPLEHILAHFDAAPVSPGQRAALDDAWDALEGA